MRDNHAVNRAVGSDRCMINDPVNRISEKFETGNERNIQLAAREPSAKRGWVIKHYLAGPAVGQRPRVEIFNTADAKIARLDGVSSCHNLRAGKLRLRRTIGRS